MGTFRFIIRRPLFEAPKINDFLDSPEQSRKRKKHTEAEQGSTPDQKGPTLEKHGQRSVNIGSTNSSTKVTRRSKAIQKESTMANL